MFSSSSWALRKGEVLGLTGDWGDLDAARYMQILRHSRIAMTMEIYTEVPSALARQALRKLGQWLEEAQT